MDLEEARERFNQLNICEKIYARPIFNGELMGRLSELFSGNKYKKFESFIEKDDINSLRSFFFKYYKLNNACKELDFYKKTVSVEFDICFTEKIETKHPYYLGFYSDAIPLYDVIKMLKVYFDNSNTTNWLTGKIISPKESNNSDDKKFEIKGHIIFAASPVSEKEATFLLDEKTAANNVETDESKEFFDYVGDCDNKSCYATKTVADKNITLPIKSICWYNIGQGNCVMLNGGNNERIFFDVGLTRYNLERKQDEVAKNIEELKDQVPDVIILSHWDTDHILGLSLWNDDVYKKYWIVPDIFSLWFKLDKNRNNKIQERKTKQVSSYAFRVFMKLVKCKSSKIYIINEEETKKCIYKEDQTNDALGIEIWTGCRKSSGAKNNHIINRANNFGLIMTVNGHYKDAILCGDCDYDIIPDELKERKYDCVNVSHHGSKMSKFPFSPPDNTRGVAIVSYGIFNTFGHPDRFKLTEISDKGYQIITTVGRSKYIWRCHHLTASC